MEWHMGSIVAVGAKLRHIKIKKSNARIKPLPVFVELGFKSYNDYLSSDLWREIRDKKLKECPSCECCGKVADQVHHYSYCYSVMIGQLTSHLLSVCDECHHRIEFDGPTKRNLKAAQKELIAILHSLGQSSRAMGLKYGRKSRDTSCDLSHKNLFSKKAKKKRARVSACDSRPDRVRFVCKQCGAKKDWEGGHCKACVEAGRCYVPRPQYS
jgi:hypothetical protein